MMNLVQILLIIVIITFLVLFLTRMIANAKREDTEVIEYTPQQHPIYPFIQYDIREVLPPSRRTYMRYPYYASRYGIYMR